MLVLRHFVVDYIDNSGSGIPESIFHGKAVILVQAEATVTKTKYSRVRFIVCFAIPLTFASTVFFTCSMKTKGYLI